jgi:hypothetical protein
MGAALKDLQGMFASNEAVQMVVAANSGPGGLVAVTDQRVVFHANTLGTTDTTSVRRADIETVAVQGSVFGPHAVTIQAPGTVLELSGMKKRDAQDMRAMLQG